MCITPNRLSASITPNGIACSIDTFGTNYAWVPSGLWAAGCPASQFGLSVNSFPTDGGGSIYSVKTVVKSSLGILSSSLRTYNPDTGLWDTPVDVLEPRAAGFYIYDPTNATPSTGKYEAVPISPPDISNNSFYANQPVY